MQRNEIEERVKQFLIDDFEIEAEKLVPEARLREDIGIDSLDWVDIVVMVDQVFGFRIKAEEMTEVVTLAQFYDYIELHLHTSEPAPSAAPAAGTEAAESGTPLTSHPASAHD